MSASTVLPLFVAGSLLLTLFGVFLIAFVVMHQRRMFRNKLEKSKLNHDNEQKMLAARIEEHERAIDSVSKEIHDNLGQQASVANINMFMLAMYATDERQVEIIEHTKTILGGMIKEIRNISHSLNSDFIKKVGLINMLQEELNNVTFASQIKSDIKIIGTSHRYLPEIELLIYRVAQEAIHNVSKHAKATMLQIILTYGADSFTMTVSDNGIGFQNRSDSTSGGIGLLNMRSRAEMLNGILNIKTSASDGCVVVLQLTKTNEIIDLSLTDDYLSGEQTVS